MAEPKNRKSFLERCTSALVPSNWGIKSNWAKIPLTIVSPIWVGPGALWCYAASKVQHLGDIFDIARATQQLRDTRLIRGPGGLPTLKGPTTLRNPMQTLIPSPTFRTIGQPLSAGGGSGLGLGAGTGLRLGARTAPAQGAHFGQSGIRRREFEPRPQLDIRPRGGLANFDTRLNVPGLSSGAFGGVGAGFDRPVVRPTNFASGGLAKFDTRLTMPGLGGASPTSFGAGGLSNFDTRLSVPGLTPSSFR